MRFEQATPPGLPPIAQAPQTVIIREVVRTKEPTSGLKKIMTVGNIAITAAALAGLSWIASAARDGCEANPVCMAAKASIPEIPILQNISDLNKGIWHIMDQGK